MGLTALAAWILLALVFGIAGLTSYLALSLLGRHTVQPVPVSAKDNRDRAFIGAFLLGSWVVLSMVSGPGSPKVMLATAIVVGLPFMIISLRSRNKMPTADWNRAMVRFSLIWLLLTGSAVLLAHGLLYGLSILFVDE